MKWARTVCIGGSCDIYAIDDPDKKRIASCYGSSADAIIEEHNRVLEDIAKIISKALESVVTD